ncbi:hypothetical protein BHM03_00019712, partial [Ensete ventricosum]
GNASRGRTTYVHCKAGRGRSTTIVLCYLVQHKNMTPTAALEYVRSRRPRVLLAPSQWKAVQQYSQCKLEFPAIRSPSPIGGDEVLVTEADLEGYETFMIACEDRSLSSNVTAIVPARTRMVMRRLCCICTSLKSSTGGQPVASRFHEIHAC